MSFAVAPVLALLAGPAGPAVAGMAEAPRPAARRSVLLVIADDQARGAFGAYGNPVIRTPSLDRLAAEGVRFTRAFATVASCSPSRATLLTGLHTHTHGQYGLAHATHNQHSFDSVKSLPALLRGRYRTGIIGKDHVKPDSVYPFEVRLTSGFRGNRDVAEMARRAREFFTADDRPFFLVVGYSDPHRAGEPRSGWGGFANDQDYAGIERITYRPEDVIVPPFLPDQPEVRAELAEYYQAVSRLDQGVGLLLRALEESGRAGETLVVYLSDNGMPFPGAKTTLYDAGIFLPLVVRAPPPGPRGVVNEALVSWIDVAPTVLDWTATPPPEGLPGRSLLPVLGQERPPGWDTVYASHQMHEITMYYPMRAIRTRTHKLIWNLAHELSYPHASDLWHSPTWQGILRRGDGKMGRRSVEAYLRRPEYELYDLAADPDETRNLAGEPALAALREELKARLLQMLAASGDPWVSEAVR
jgi:N-sulfoglucosamine sulfohydrolase